MIIFGVCGRSYMVDSFIIEKCLRPMGVVGTNFLLGSKKILFFALAEQKKAYIFNLRFSLIFIDKNIL